MSTVYMNVNLCVPVDKVASVIAHISDYLIEEANNYHEDCKEEQLRSVYSDDEYQ